MALLEWEDGFSYAIELDCSENESYEDTNETTDRAVERGGTVTDHVRQNPSTITIEGTITNSPLRALAPTRDRAVTTQAVTLRAGCTGTTTSTPGCWRTAMARSRSAPGARPSTRPSRCRPCRPGS